MDGIRSLSSRMLRCGRHEVDLSRPRVMGIVNLTADSFSDGGRHRSVDDAIAHALRLIDEGADFIDVGAESTRPGAVAVSIEHEWERLAPFMFAMRDAPVPVSVDTRKAEVMARALEHGASMINDVAGFASEDARLAVAPSDCALCVMHMQGEPATMQDAPHYDDVVGEVIDLLSQRVERLINAGVTADRIVVDPGFGFGKTFEHNLALLRDLEALTQLGPPVLVGLSRKGTIGTLTGRPVGERMAGSVAAALAAVDAGAAIVRVHDVAETVDALRVWGAVRSRSAESPVLASGLSKNARLPGVKDTE